MPDRLPLLGDGLAHIKARLNELPLDKKGALIIAVEWKAGIPILRPAIAAKIGTHWTLAADAQLKFKDKPEAKVFAAFTW
jgi:hypothetical protein